MTSVLSHPFRITGGRAATVEQHSPRHLTEAVAHLASTRPGERPLVPSFGVADPTVVGLDPLELATVAAVHAPEIDIVAVTITDIDGDSYVDVEVARAQS